MALPSRKPKELGEWIELDYYRRPRGLRRSRRLLGWGIFVLGIAAVALTFWPGKAAIFKSGPVSTAHDIFNGDCHKCHTELFRPALRFWPRNDKDPSAHVANETCEKCHFGPIHNPNQIPSDPTCVTCHMEHQGRAALARVEDPFCVECHTDLRAHFVEGKKPTLAEHITDFSKDHHPEFRPPSKDPGYINFPHDKHLQGPIPPVPRRPGDETETLNCQSCHQVDNQGRYMKAINYDTHCARCHLLRVSVDGIGPKDKLWSAAVAFEKAPAPHPLQKVEEVPQALRERYLQFFRDHREVLQANPSSPAERSFPGRSWMRPVTGEEWTWVKHQLGEAERSLFGAGGGCGYCHQESPTSPQLPGGGKLPVYLKTNIKTHWFEKARFSHTSHQMLKCIECHQNAPLSTSSKKHLLPQIENCQKCHNPKGARTDCIECHQYHDQKPPTPFPGDWTIDECLRERP